MKAALSACVLGAGIALALGALLAVEFLQTTGGYQW